MRYTDSKQTRQGASQPESDFLSRRVSASGRWAQKNPFDPKTFGLIRGYYPIGSSEPKIVLCTLSLDKNFLRLAKAVDGFIARHEGLEWSVIQVADSKGAQRGGYTPEEVSLRMEELQKIARQNKLKHLSFALSSPNASYFAGIIGLTGSNNLLVAHVAISPVSKDDTVVKWFEQRETSQLSKEVIREIVGSLEKSVADSK